MSAIKRTKGLGRGLEALLGPLAAGPDGDIGEQVRMLALDKLQAGKYQPRSRMDESSLVELADSIKRQGIIQPILVRPVGSGKYEIIAGERRFRASKIAGLNEVPVLVRAIPDESALAMALIENIQREDLNPLEEALGVQRLIREFDLTHEEAASAIGRSRSATSNMLRLLNLAEPVQTMLLAGDIEMGHARALLALSSAEQIACANELVNKRLSVREAEKRVHGWLGHSKGLSPRKTKQNADVRRLEASLGDWLTSVVQLKATAAGKGSITIEFHSFDALDGILQRIGFSNSQNSD